VNDPVAPNSLRGDVPLAIDDAVDGVDNTTTKWAVTDVTAVEYDDAMATPVDAGDDNATADGDSDDLEATRARIEQTRAEMSETIAAIQEKLQPENLVQQAKETVREVTVGKVESAISTAGERVQGTVGQMMGRGPEHVTSGAPAPAKGMGGTVIETIKQHPLPTALAGLGLGWLVMKGRKHQDHDATRVQPQTWAGNGYGYGYGPGGYAGAAYPGPVIAQPPAASGAFARPTPPSYSSGTADQSGGGMMTNLADRAGDAVSRGQDALGAVAGGAQHTAGRVAGQVGGMVDGAGSGVMETLRQNPLPVALAGLSVGWLYLSARDADRARIARGMSRWDQEHAAGDPYSPYYDGAHDGGQTGVAGMAGQVKETVATGAGKAVEAVTGSAAQAREAVTGTAGQAAEAVGGGASQAATAVSSLANQTGELVAGAAEQARGTADAVATGAGYTVQSGVGAFQRMLDENPLAVGVLAAGLGLAAGLTAPSTPQESQLMGEARDTLVSRAQDMAQQTVQKVQTVTQDAIGAAVDTAKQEAQEQQLIPGATHS